MYMYVSKSTKLTLRRSFIPYNLKIPIDQNFVERINLYIVIFGPSEVGENFVGTYMKFVHHQLYTEI